MTVLFYELNGEAEVYGRQTNNFHRCLLDALHYCLRRRGHICELHGLLRQVRP